MSRWQRLAFDIALKNMIRAKVKVKPARFQASFKRFAEKSKKLKRVLLKDQAKFFVRDVVGITPPSQKYKISKELGDNAVRGDLASLLIPTRNASAPEAAVIHKRFRTRRGRVDRRRKAMPARNVPALRKLLLSRVGILASGWNAAAAKLGTRLPVWITRHGTRYGRCDISIGVASMSIRIVNMVRYVGAVKGLERRVQAAMDNRARQMDKQMRALTKKAAGSSGLRVR